MEMTAPQLERSLTLRGAVTLNLLDMIGVGPFLTLPLLLAAMGGPQAMVGWVLGAGLGAFGGGGARGGYAGGRRDVRVFGEDVSGAVGTVVEFSVCVSALCVGAAECG